MGIFGWSYPPGCNSVPGDEEYSCSVCGGQDIDPRHANPERKVYACICLECPECGEVGNPNCYKPTAEGGHGLILSETQKTQAAAVLEAQRLFDEALAREYSPEQIKQREKDEEELQAFYQEIANARPDEDLT
jgi:hypothetical protein